MLPGAVVISGCSGGIGQALVSEFQAQGWVIVGVDRRQADPALEYFFESDLRNISDRSISESLRKFFADVNLELSINALINCAATQTIGNFETLESQSLQESFSVNVVAAFELSRILSPVLEQQGGSIVNIGSIHAELTKKGFLPYSVSKAALRGLTRALALELGGRVRVNSIEPAAVETEMLKSGFVGSPEKYAKLVEYHPSQKIGKPDEIAQFVRYLIEDAPSFLHGSTIQLDGGISKVLHDPA